MAEVIRYVDPDATGGGTGVDWTNAYTSLSAWNAAEATNLVTDTDWHHAYVRASSGTADTTAVSLGNGWTTGAANYILIEAASSDWVDKSGIDTAKYRLDVFGSVSTTLHSYVRLLGFQIINTTSGGHNINIVGGGVGIIINSVYLKVPADGNGVYSNNGANGITIINTIAWSAAAPGTSSEGFYSQNSATMDIYNSISHGFNDGIERDNGTVTVKNCAVFANTTDFDGTMTIDYCASDDGTGTNPVSPSGSDWDNEYTDPTNGDFTLLNGGNCYHGGADNPSSGLYTTDMEGDAYNSGAYSIGVDEYVVVGGLSIPVAMNHYRNQGVA